MPVVTHVAFEVVIPDHVEAAADMQEKFADVLTINATRINDRRAFKVGTSGDFSTKLAGPSSQRFSPMIDSAFVSRRGRTADSIVFAQKKNLEQGFEQYNDNLNAAFATVGGVVAKGFVTNVQNKKQNLSRELGRKTLRFTGDRIRGLGVSSIVASILTATPGAQGLLRAGDTWTSGAPYAIAIPAMLSTAKQAIVQNITRFGIDILNSDFDATEMTAANTALNLMMSGICDTTLSNAFKITMAASESYLMFQKVAGIFQLICAVRTGTA